MSFVRCQHGNITSITVKRIETPIFLRWFPLHSVSRPQPPPTILALSTSCRLQSVQNPCRFNSATIDVAVIRVQDTADFALKLFATISTLTKARKAGESASVFVLKSAAYRGVWVFASHSVHVTRGELEISQLSMVPVMKDRRASTLQHLSPACDNLVRHFRPPSLAVQFAPALWLKIPADFCHYISVAAHYGFQFHHTQPKYVMMCLWLPEDVPNKIPQYGTHQVGVAGERAR